MKNANLTTTLLSIFIICSTVAVLSNGLHDASQMRSRSYDTIEPLQIIAPKMFNYDVDHDLKLYCSIDEPTPCELYMYMKSVGVQHPEIVTKQSILETGWFNSRICKEYRNFFGMCKPGKRQSTAISWHKIATGHRKLIFDHWTSSVDDYVLYQQYMFSHRPFDGDTDDEYLAYVTRRGYSETAPSKYINRVSSISFHANDCDCDEV